MNLLDTAVHRAAILCTYARSSGHATITISVDSMKLVIEAAERSTTETTVIVLESIVDAVCVTLGVTRSALSGGSRPQPLQEARQMVYHFGREYAGASYPAIGRVVRKDHSTVMSGCQRVKERLTKDHRRTVDMVYQIGRRLGA